MSLTFKSNYKQRNMENMKQRSEWRKLVKKLQRKRKRQKIAKERDKKEEEDFLNKQNDPNYQSWFQHQSELEEYQRFVEEHKHKIEEEAWIHRELIAQERFRLEDRRRKMDEAAKEALRVQQHKELEEREAAQRKRREEKERLQAEAHAKFEHVMQKMEFYLSNEGEQTPTELKSNVETKPGEKFCEFYEKTNCCSFGFRCTFNHRRPLLSCIILIHHFFVHPMLEETVYQEYESADSYLEMNERDLRADYDVFFEDACSELETFGRIRNFRTVRNVLPHLRGNVFVEYEDKRSALKAFSKLQGRFYASRRLAVEFSNIVQWRGAVCGLSISRKCPHGLRCRYLHIFGNPGNKYNTGLENTKRRSKERKTLPTPPNGKSVNMTPLLSWDDVSPFVSRRNWRWSESPEPVISSKQELAPKCSTAKEQHIENKKISKISSRRKRAHSKESKSDSRKNVAIILQGKNSSHHRKSHKKI